MGSNEAQEVEITMRNTSLRKAFYVSWYLYELRVKNRPLNKLSGTDYLMSTYKLVIYSAIDP